MFRRDVRIILSMLLAGVLLCGCDNSSEPPVSVDAAPPDSGSQNLVIVEGEAITADELDRQLDRLVLAEVRVPSATLPTDVIRSDLRSQALSQLVDREVQLLEARKRKLEITDAEVEERIKTLEGRYASPEEFRQVFMERLRYTPESLRAATRNDLLIEKLRRQWVEEHPLEVSEEEMRELYQVLRQRGPLQKEGRDMTFEEFMAEPKLHDTAAVHKANKEYLKWVSELRSSAQIVETGPAQLR